MTSMQQYHDKALERIRKEVSDGDGFLWTGGKEAQVIADMLIRKTDIDVTFLTVETGNQLEPVKEFRKEYHEKQGFEWEVRKYDKLLEEVIDNPADPRSYHGEYGTAMCPVCEVELMSVTTEADYECPTCGFTHTVPDEFRQGLSDVSSWDVSDSCGALKVVPLRRFIETDGYHTLVTGVREDDPLADPDEFGAVVDRSEPVRHTRVNPLHDWSSEHVWAYISREFVSYPDCYDNGYRHTDSECCIDDDAVSEHGEGGRDPEKEAAADRLRDMGYV